MHRDASPGKDRRVRNFDSSLNDIQQQEVWRQREGKELARAEWKVSFNGVAVGEDGKPMKKQIILSERYGRDNLGLAGGSLEVVFGVLLAKAAAQVVIKEVLNWVKGKAWKKESIEQNMLGILIGRDFTIGLAYLDDARDAPNEPMQMKLIDDARMAFTSASRTETSSAQQAKSMFCTAVCYHLLGARVLAIKWFEDAQKKGGGLNRSEVKEIEDFLKKLSYPSTSYSALPQFNRLAIGSSSTPDRITFETLQDKNEALENDNRTLQRDKRELQDKVSTLDQNNKALQSENSRLTRLLNQALQEKQNLERTIQALQEKQNVAGTSGTDKINALANRD